MWPSTAKCWMSKIDGVNSLSPYSGRHSSNDLPVLKKRVERYVSFSLAHSMLYRVVWLDSVGVCFGLSLDCQIDTIIAEEDVFVRS